MVRTHVKKSVPVQKQVTRKDKPTLLWVGDAVAHTGFARVTHAVLDKLRHYYNVHVLGINYKGDPHSYPYPIWPAYIGGDVYGYQRLPSLLSTLRPDVVCILNDPWVVSQYLSSTAFSTPVYAYMPVDGCNLSPVYCEPLQKLTAAIAYTEFGKQELQKAGVTVPIYVIPHGIDTDVFRPIPKDKARAELNLDPSWYIVGAVNRNQPRKRLDLLFSCFAQWALSKPAHVKLYYHGAINDVGWDIIGMARYYNIEDRLILTNLGITSFQGIDYQKLPYVYSSFDVQLSTTMGEGWGLTTMEGMACGVPQIVPEYSALGEWCRGAVHYVPCTLYLMHTGGINTVGGIVDPAACVEALECLYTKEQSREQLKNAGLSLVRQSKYRWSTIASQFHAIFSRT